MPAIIVARNSRGLIGHCDRACRKVPLFGPACISLFGQLKVINAEIGGNNALPKISALVVCNQGMIFRRAVRIPNYTLGTRRGLVPEIGAAIAYISMAQLS